MSMTDVLYRIRERRRAYGYTQDDIGNMLGITGKAYSKIETGVNELRPEYIRKLCDFLDIPYLDILLDLLELRPLFRPLNAVDFNDEDWGEVPIGAWTDAVVKSADPENPDDVYKANLHNWILDLSRQGKREHLVNFTSEEFSLLKSLSVFTGLSYNDSRLVNAVLGIVQLRSLGVMHENQDSGFSW